MKHSWLLAAGLLLAAFPAHGEDPALAGALRSPARSPAFVARDAMRHPAAELAFFGLKPTQTVVELLPGGGYWTEFLAPYLHDYGHYYVVSSGKSSEGVAAFQAKLAADPAWYGKITQTLLSDADIAPPHSVDLVLSFRSLHDWLRDGTADQVLAKIHRALKPGGVFGIEDHRGQRQDPQDPKAADGYVRQDYAIALIEKAGFKLVASSEMDANPRDTAHWPKGVWTLPPVLALGARDRAYYQSIGEADNFVLRFRKVGN